ncbi:hypothetical protein BGZ73_009155 [Actinomortierella ambigua]|nr:hypothetical protein BGZ73_009155 [Actinomortierella ambigua]
MLVPKTRAPLQQLFPADESPHKLVDAPPGTGWPVTYTGYKFPVKGQGTISFTFQTDQPFRIVLGSEKNLEGTLLVLEVNLKQTVLRSNNGTDDAGVIAKTCDKKALLDPGTEISYWMSLDYMNARVRFGKGEMLPQLIVFEAPLTVAASTYKSLCYIGLATWTGTPLPVALDHMLWPLPVVLTPSPMLVPSDRMTLNMIAHNEATVVASLPDACRVLYGNVAGPDIKLDMPDFRDFSTAINHSIITPGCICYEKLKKKAGEFGKFEPQETYLRITIGPNQGDSPGSPYVLEIWPGGHYSPIHDHGAACAVIKVLHGDIWVELYPALNPKITDFFTEAIFHEGEVTYLTPEYYQVHRLVNRNQPGNMTATIQCYRYPDDNTVHWEYFDYIDGTTIKRFTPNSDWEYSEFRELIRAEWAKAQSVVERPERRSNQ